MNRVKTQPRRLKANNSAYEGAGQGRRAQGWDAPDGSISTLSIPHIRTLRNRARAAERNDGYALSIIEKRVSNLIGTGICPRPQIDDPDLRSAMNLLWEDWVDEADADGRTDHYGQQALVSRMVERDGECFARMRPRRPEDGFAVPLQVQLLAADFVPLDKNERARNGNQIKAGVEFNGFGQRVAYWMYRQHPGSFNVMGTVNQLVRVPASEVLHIFEVIEPGQVRGVPRLAAVLNRLRSLDNYDDAVLFRQEVANLFAGFIKKTAPDGPADLDPTTGRPFERDRSGDPMIGLEPGTMNELYDGEEVQFSDPPDAGSTYKDFMRQQLQAAAEGAGIPYGLLTGDMTGLNDRLLRVLINEFRRRIEQLQFGVYVHQFCRPVRAAWMDMAYLSGALVLPDYVRRRREYLRTRWIPQGHAYMHPVQDVQGKLLEIGGGLASRSEHALRTGYDAEVIDKENAQDNERAKRLGLEYKASTAAVDDESAPPGNEDQQ